MKSLYIFFLLAVLIFTDSTPANATSLHRCVFKVGENPLNLPTKATGIPSGLRAGYNRNTINGILEFTRFNDKKLFIGGFIDLDGVGGIELIYDLHVARCSTKTSAEPGDPAIIDLDGESFDTPIATTINKPLPKLDANTDCCFVVDEFAATERILGVARLQQIF
ncbi:5369_t:CDS:1 [Paraglomus occultum]|uniref:5369_t:CDS:1 n=1 Tax=Paraglomus occultum TaxID=144539 RepID=A0A9N9G7X6_9GLOM|nr:5369_t:CDS:1 [Paraglomus occultum]